MESDQHLKLLLELKKNEPEIFNFVRQQVDQRLVVGVKSSPIVVPDDKSRAVHILKELGFEPQVKSPLRFSAPPKDKLLRPLRRLFAIVDQENEKTSLQPITSPLPSPPSSPDQDRSTSLDVDMVDKLEKMTLSKMPLSPASLQTPKEAPPKKRFKVSIKPISLSGIQFGKEFEWSKNAWILLDYKNQELTFEFIDGETKRVTFSMHDIRELSKDFSTMEIHLKSLANVSFTSNGNPCEDFTKGSLEKHKTIRFQFTKSTSFLKHYELLQVECTQLELSRKYEVGQELGNGAYATVKLATSKEDGKKYAIKIIDKKKLKGSDCSKVKAEYDIVHQLKHPNIIQMKEFIETDTQIYLVMEYCSGGELFNLYQEKDLSEDEIKIVMRQLLDALHYLHSQNKIHRDVKLENILLEKENALDIKLIDFGIAKVMNLDKTQTYVGTEYYLAPEVIKVHEGSLPGYDTKCDIWACGVVLYLLLFGDYPFENSTSILSGKFKDPPKKKINPDVLDFLKHLLEPDVTKRFSASQALSHKWFQN